MDCDGSMILKKFCHCSCHILWPRAPNRRWPWVSPPAARCASEQQTAGIKKSLNHNCWCCLFEKKLRDHKICMGMYGETGVNWEVSDTDAPFFIFLLIHFPFVLQCMSYVVEFGSRLFMSHLDQNSTSINLELWNSWQFDPFCVAGIKGKAWNELQTSLHDIALRLDAQLNTQVDRSLIQLTFWSLILRRSSNESTPSLKLVMVQGSVWNWFSGRPSDPGEWKRLQNFKSKTCGSTWVWWHSSLSDMVWLQCPTPLVNIAFSISKWRVCYCRSVKVWRPCALSFGMVTWSTCWSWHREMLSEFYNRRNFVGILNMFYLL